MFRRLPLFALVLVSARAAAVPPPSAASPDPGSPVVLEPLVVRDQLDRAREDIVPGLGAAEFQMDRSQIDALALGANAAFSDVLLRAPGVAQDSFGQVHIRGEHADLQYRINDVLLPEGLSGFGQELDTRFVSTLSILTGALPAQYGYRTAGVVDIHTRAASRSGGEVTLYGGSFETARANIEATLAGAQRNAYVTASVEHSALGLENPTPARSALHDRKNQAKAFAYFSGVIDATSRLNLMLSTSVARFQIPNHPGEPVQFAVRGAPALSSAELDDNQREENHYAIVAYQKSAGTFSGQISAFARYSAITFAPDVTGDLRFSGVASQVRRSQVGDGLETDAKWDLGANHTLRAGALVAATNAGARTATSVLAIDDRGAATSDVPFTIDQAQRQLGWLGGIYAQDEWDAAPDLTVNYGVRADTSHAHRHEGQLSPRVNVVYKLSQAVSLHGGYARYFTPPPVERIQATDLAPFAGTTNAAAVTTSSDVRAERAHYFDLGASVAVTPRINITVDAYDKRTRDQLDEGQFGQALIFSPFNYRQGRTRGIEISGNYTRGGLSAYGNVACSRSMAREIVSGEFQFEPQELDYIASHDVHPDHDQLITASAGLSYRRGRTLAYVDALYGSGLRRGFANSAHLPAYHPVNLGVEHTFALTRHREVRARLDVVNVLDESYALRDGSGIGVGAPQFGQRRGIFGGVTFAF